ncbi:hypothetical protein AO073_21960 [Pseudomonas syringae ICMP 11293]|uniref:ABC transporter ATP-binding protein n=1 Tax=Pseudomonas syringae TaxID=317 RepID=UPI0007315C55|nr:ABC transporter ATP-binding protein [Pseudomonas syringae]KTB90683.1 hypothetical protein AO073_21960 [Pseudomonas syringae ICMP 11293]
MNPTTNQHNLFVDGLSVHYRKHQVIENLTLPALQPGRIVALVGPNAAGKSTLLRAIAGLTPSTGDLWLGQAHLLQMNRQERAEHIGFMPQTLPQGVDLSVLETLFGALRTSSRDYGNQQEQHLRAHRLLIRLGIEPLALRPLGQLSGGQRQMVSLAQAVIRNPQVLLLDEPTSALDLRHQASVMGTARSLADDGRIVVAVLHDLTLAARWADEVMVLKHGGLYSAGTPRATLTEQMLTDVYQVQARVEACSRGHLHIAVDGPLQGVMA